jgi:asparagine synthase (glutamine-hydrolysing)
MCGICGIVDRTGKSIDERIVKGMCLEMVHRGPDDEGIYISSSKPSVGLGHRRLSIIDLSPAGRQPMFNEDKSISLVLNGEIYNFRELVLQMKERGHIFRSTCDAEVVVHLYEEYGRECVRHLRGMFAFGLWDEKRKSLLLARDRAGKKPLIYSCIADKMVFASELKAILASGMVEKQVNNFALDKYMHFGYIGGPETIYKNVFKLLPAHTLTWEDGRIKVENYWELDFSRKIRISEKEAQDEVLRLLEESVRLRLYSEVPLGAFLSGGIDSSTVVALMSRFSRKINTFSIGFDEKDYDELGYARKIAERFSTNHHEFIVKPKAMEVIPILVERYGEPYADSSCIPTYYVARKTKEFVTVALNGDGGDELFGGYERYQAMLFSESYAKLPSVIRGSFEALLRLMPYPIEEKDPLGRAQRFFRVASQDRDERYIEWTSACGHSFISELYSDGFKANVYGNGYSDNIHKYLGNTRIKGTLGRLLALDTATYLVDDLLVKVDIASMANSLEARSPFLDHKLMEFAASLPEEYKIKFFSKKHILKKAIRGILPDENIFRKKMGFGIPLGRWFRTELKGILCETLLSERSLKRGYFKPEAIRMAVQKHISGAADYSRQLWAIFMLELWHRRFIDHA